MGFNSEQPTFRISLLPAVAGAKNPCLLVVCDARLRQLHLTSLLSSRGNWSWKHNKTWKQTIRCQQNLYSTIFNIFYWPLSANDQYNFGQWSVTILGCWKIIYQLRWSSNIYNQLVTNSVNQNTPQNLKNCYRQKRPKLLQFDFCGYLQ